MPLGRQTLGSFPLEATDPNLEVRTDLIGDRLKKISTSTEQFIDLNESALFAFYVVDVAVKNFQPFA